MVEVIDIPGLKGARSWPTLRSRTERVISRKCTFGAFAKMVDLLDLRTNFVRILFGLFKEAIPKRFGLLELKEPTV